MKKAILLIMIIIPSVFLSCEADLLDAYEGSKVYKLRDIGPAGGWIFYINPNWETDGWRYLEAAPADALSYTAQWSNSGVYANGVSALPADIGTGLSNSDTINVKFGTYNSAAYYCETYVYNGYSDWFLPSKDELYKMYVNLHKGTDENGVTYSAVGSFSLKNGSGNDTPYWSSTETSDSGVSALYFNGSGWLNYSKTGGYSFIRAARRF